VKNWWRRRESKERLGVAQRDSQPFPVSTNATTFGPQAVSVITLSASYRAITLAVALRTTG